MQIELKLKKILPALMGLIFLWAIFFTAKFLLEEKENMNQFYIPANSKMVLNIDGKQFISSALYDIGYQYADDDIFKELKQLTNPSEGKNKIRDAGIDFLSDIVIFSGSVGEKDILFVLFNLTDADKFSASMKERITNHQAYAVKENVGIIALDLSNSIDKNTLQAQVDKLEKNQIASTLKSDRKRENLFKIHLKDYQHHGILETNIETRLENNQVVFNGDLKLAERPRFSPFSLKGDGFHLSAAIISKALQDSVQRMLATSELQLPKINRISMNYRGLNLDDGYVPLADILLEFNTEIDLAVFSSQSEILKKLKFKPIQEMNNIQLNTVYQMMSGSEKFEFKVLDSKTVFIGKNSKNILQKNSGHLLRIEGDLNRLTEIKGGGLIGMGINLYPPFRVSKEFIDGISKSNMTIVPQNGKYKVEGNLKFKEGKFPLSEIVKLLIGLDQAF